MGALDLTGERFGMLVALRLSGKNKHRQNLWLCQCDCGDTSTPSAAALRSGKTTSCGCYGKSVLGKNSKKYNHSDGPEYTIWRGMKQRCSNSARANYARYGGVGVSVCERWLNDFEAFYSDMGNRPSPKHSIDRIDPSGDYEPSNCRWADIYEQANNKTNVHTVTVNGEKKPRGIAIRDSGLPYATVVRRLNLGWSSQEALTTPVGARRK